MMLSFKIIMIFLSAVINFSWQITQPICAHRNCKNLLILYNVSNPAISVNRTITKARVFSIGENKIKGISFNVTRTTRFCQTNFIAADKGCSSYSTKSLVYDTDQIKESVKKLECLAGRKCDYSGDCTGALAYECLNENPSLNRYIKKSDDWINRSPWNNMLHDTCEQYWGCHFRTIEVMVHTSMVDGKRTYYVMIEGDKIELNVDDETSFSKNMMNYNFPPVHEVFSEAELECLNTEDIRICVVKKSSVLKKGTVYRFNSQGLHSGDEYIINIKDTLASDNMNSYFEGLQSSDVGVSKEDLVKVVSMLLFENLQARHNAIALSESLIDVQKVLVKTLKASALSNELFMGNFLEVKAINKWVNSKESILCPCMNSEEGQSDNCRGGNIFKRGFWWVKEDSDECLKLGERPKSIVAKVFGESMDLSLEGISSEDVQGLDSDTAQDTLSPGSSDVPLTKESYTGFFSLIDTIWEKIQGFGSIAGYLSLILWYKSLGSVVRAI